MRLFGRRHWIFDLDGTLTVPAHDFAAIREMLGLPDGIGILEALESMPEERSEPLIRKLDAFEYDLAAGAEAADGALELLDDLARRRVSLGIVTRNSLRNVERTLAAARLDRFFSLDAVITREHTRPKPEPDGIRRLLAGWNAPPEAAVMVGNHLIDLLAGRAAGTATILVGAGPEADWARQADVAVDGLRDVMRLAATATG